MNDWQDWSGGAMPVPAAAWVEVTFRNGATQRAAAGSFPRWAHDPAANLDDPRSPAWWDVVRWRSWSAPA